MAGHDMVGGFTASELKVASFWVRNGFALRRGGYIALVALSVLFWGYAIVGLLDTYVISYPRESRLTRQIALNQQLLATLESDRPQDVSSGDVTGFKTTDNRYDMAVEITNPNSQWWIEFNYHFSLSGEETPKRTGYVLPESRQVLMEPGYAAKTRGGSSATFIVDTIRWHRMDPAFAGSDFKTFKTNRFNVVAEDVTYDTDISLADKHVGQTSFALHNLGSYGFWNVDLVLRLYRGSSVIAVNKITVSRLSPGEKRALNVVWFDTLPGVTKTEIIPQVNVLDPSVYLPTQYFNQL